MGKLYDGSQEKLIAVCIAGIDEYTQTSYIDTISRLADMFGYKVIFFTSFSTTCMAERFWDGEMDIYSLIDYELLDGLLLFGETIKRDSVVDTIVASARAAKVPVVSIDRRIEGCYNVLFDYKEAMEKLVRHIAGRKEFKRIEFIGGVPENPPSEERLEIFRRVMKESGRELSPSQIHYGYFWGGPTEQVMDEILSRPRGELPDAIICANDSMAIAVCSRLRGAGLRIPEDVAVTGFDGIQEASYHSPKLTTAVMEPESAISQAMEIFRMLFAGEKAETAYIIPFQTVFSESSGSGNPFDQGGKNTIVQTLYSKIDENHVMTNRMVMMMAELSACNTVTDVIECLKAFIPNMVAWKSWLCLVDDYLKDRPEVEEILNGQEEHGGYTERMNCILRRDGWEYEENIVFERSGILPDLKRDLTLCGKILIVPLHVLDKAVGYFALSYAAGGIEFHQMQNFVNTLSNELTAVKVRLEQKSMVEKFKKQSIYDALTGILNRRGFFEHMRSIYAESMKNGKKIALISIDMDGLKRINDTWGHSEGDTAICFTADALAKVCGSELCCARIGGDEFMAVGIVPEELVGSFEERLQKEFDEYNANAPRPYNVGFSIGTVYREASRSLPVEEFIRLADERMYAQKEEHRRTKGYARA